MARASFLFVALAMSAGCGSEAVGRLPEEPEQLVLYSIDGPSYFKNEGQLAPDQAKGETLHGYPVLGKVEITDSAQRRAVLAAIKAAVRSPEPQSKCFIPRHAIRSVKAGETIDMLICFECHNYEEHREGKPLPGGARQISSSPRDLLDMALTDAGIPLATKGLLGKE